MTEHIEAIQVKEVPTIDTSDQTLLLQDFVKQIKELRKSMGMTQSNTISLFVYSPDKDYGFIEKNEQFIKDECVARSVYLNGDPEGGKAIMSNGKTFLVNMKLERPVPQDFLKRMVLPHKKISRTVTKDDIQRVLEEYAVLLNLCFIPDGSSKGAYAMAHPQIDDVDPLRLFVTSEMECVINPVIIKHSKTTVDSEEGCRSYQGSDHKIVQRYNQIEVQCQTLIADPADPKKLILSEVMTESVSGKRAKIFQHEIGHTLGHYIYDDVISADDCVNSI